MNRYFKVLHRNTQVIYADSTDHRAIKNEWLPGGTITAICRDIVGKIDKESIKVDKIGKWSTFTMSNKNKKVLFITICRIL